MPVNERKLSKLLGAYQVFRKRKIGIRPWINIGVRL